MKDSNGKDLHRGDLIYITGDKKMGTMTIQKIDEDIGVCGIHTTYPEQEERMEKTYMKSEDGLYRFYGHYLTLVSSEMMIL